MKEKWDNFNDFWSCGGHQVHINLAYPPCIVLEHIDQCTFISSCSNTTKSPLTMTLTTIVIGIQAEWPLNSPILTSGRTAVLASNTIGPHVSGYGRILPAIRILSPPYLASSTFAKENEGEWKRGRWREWNRGCWGVWEDVEENERTLRRMRGRWKEKLDEIAKKWMISLEVTSTLEDTRLVWWTKKRTPKMNLKSRLTFQRIQAERSKLEIENRLISFLFLPLLRSIVWARAHRSLCHPAIFAAFYLGRRVFGHSANAFWMARECVASGQWILCLQRRLRRSLFGCSAGIASLAILQSG